jgi:D-3-phosphoglycerate dehydrogenase / 2-oxoglutarate reductase
VWVCNVPDYGTEEVALHASAMVLSLLRRLAFHDRLVRAGTWNYVELAPIPRASELVLGIIGLGRIGQQTARYLRPVFGRIVAYDAYLPDSAGPEGIVRVPLEALLASSHVISLHVPLTEETAGMINAERLSAMPANALLVNTSRGGLIDLDALQEALDAGRLAGAALDVFAEEPLPKNHPLSELEIVEVEPGRDHAAHQGVSVGRDCPLPHAGRDDDLGPLPVPGTDELLGWFAGPRT